ncbi:MAG: cobalamin-binding protein [Thermaerobacterales bacterium]
MRLVSLTPSNTEIVHALGLDRFLVGVDDHSDYPPEVVGDLPRVGPDLQIDIDRAAALKPDLILASLSVPGMERNVEQLVERGLRHIVLNALSMEEVFADILWVARETGSEERGLQVVSRMKERLAAVSGEVEKLRAGRPPVNLFWEWWPKPLITPGRQSWINDVCRIAGARNIFEDLDAASQPVESETVVARSPDAVVLCWCGTLQPMMDPERVRQRPGWAGLAAVRDDRIFALPEELFGRPGPRLVEGAEILAGILYGAGEARLNS